VLLTFVLNRIDDTIKTPQDVLGKLDIPFLGLVPTIRTDRQPILSSPVPRHFSEAYRALRASIVFTNPTETTRVVLCASARPGEGRTTTACNMAMVLAFGGARVLLIDADLRSPAIHQKLLVTNAVGLAHLLVGQARIRETMQRTNNPNLCVITAGGTPENAPELLASERMKQLIANAKHGPFDWVVIDSPPVLSAGDAGILTGLADGVAFVLGADMTRRRLAQKAIQMITANRLKIVGAVLNRVKIREAKQPSRRAIARQYRAYYGIDGTGASKNLVKG
jgi:capsular exopolysaccharide synthesis family protein